MVSITIDDRLCEVEGGLTIVAAAAAAHGTYIPTLCHHPDLRPFGDLCCSSRIFRGERAYENQPAAEDELHRLEGCGLCVVGVEGLPEPVRACQTRVSAGMSIQTKGEALEELRRTNLMGILARHPHACLICAQREGCSLEDCSSNVPREERCCSQFHNCELRKVTEHVGVKEETPRYRAGGLAALNDEPLFARDFELCIDCGRCVRICNQVRGVDALGVVHQDGRLIVGSVAPTLIESGCKFCGACVEVCPTGCLTDKGVATGAKEHRLVPCVDTCPAAVDVPGYIRRIASGDFAGAAALVWERLPLANVLGHICFHLCECQCRRSQLDDPIAICAMKRFAMEAGDGVWLAKAKRSPESGKRIAVVGAGPAGLSAAYYLRFMGHAVTVLEATDSPGGMAATSIPGYRLLPEVLAKDLAVIESLGAEIRTRCRLDTAEAMTELLGQGYAALLVAVGLPDSKKIAIDGSTLSGVYWGLEFLTEVKAGRRFDLGEEIIVVGGGNVAVDVAMTALRLTGALVRLVCLEPREAMPAHAQEIEKAEAEGVEVYNRWGPAVILGDEGGVCGVTFQRCLTVLDDQGEFSPTFDKLETMTVDADSVILAIGQAPRGSIPKERDGVFLAGDIAGGQMSIVHAVASGRKAAERIDAYLGGTGEVSIHLTDPAPPNPWIGREEGFIPRPRIPLPCAAPEERRTDFRPIEGTYTAQEATAEARRCLQCDLRLLIVEPPLPPERWLEFHRANVEQVPPVEGVFTLADSNKLPTAIKGMEDIQAGLAEKLESSRETGYFLWEEDRMYTKRESELIQQHLERYGELPGGGDDELDDLF